MKQRFFRSRVFLFVYFLSWLTMSCSNSGSGLDPDSDSGPDLEDNSCDESPGIAACAEGSFHYAFADHSFVIKADAWECLDIVEPITWGYSGIWIEREEHSRSGVSFSLLIGRSEQAVHPTSNFKHLPNRKGHFALAVLFTNSIRYACLPIVKGGVPTASKARSRLLNLGDSNSIQLIQTGIPVLAAMALLASVIPGSACYNVLLLVHLHLEAVYDIFFLKRVFSTDSRKSSKFCLLYNKAQL